MTNVENTKPLYVAYRLDPSSYWTDGTPAVMYTVATGVSRYDAHVAADADHVTTWDCHNETWVYGETEQHKYAVVALDEDGEPIWPDHDATPESYPDIEWEDISDAAGVDVYAVAVGDWSDVSDVLTTLWSKGIAVVGHHDDTTTDTTDDEDAATVAALCKKYSAVRVIRIDADGYGTADDYMALITAHFAAE
ncbi:MAG: hypothetical protein ACHREM_12830 [Polyangiales bacterium]